MCIYSVFHQLINSIYSDLSTFFDYFNLAIYIEIYIEISHSLDIVVPSITLINQTYSKFPLFNIELVNLMQLLRRLQRTYTSSKLESDLIAFKVVDHFTRKHVSLPNRHTSLICSVVMEYFLSKLINYLSPL